jgi:thioredoxin-related protein
MNIWNQIFGITGTPGNVIINVQTGEYQVIPGAFPAENFIQTINSLLN